MPQKLNLNLKLVVYSDSEAATNNPKLKDFDYDRQLQGVQTDGIFTKRSTLGPSSSSTIAATSRSISQDATTQWTITNPKDNTYRFKWAAGTNPVLRTNRSIGGDATTQWTITMAGPVARYTASSGTAPTFASVVVGDELVIEDDGPFNLSNTGIFVVMGKGANFVEVANPSGVAEGPITQGTRADGLPPVVIQSNGPVLKGDEARIKATAFNIANRGTFTITRLTANYFDIDNAEPGYPEGPIVIGAADGIVFYPSLYKWLYVEADRKVSIRLNGDTTDNVELEPVVEGNSDQPGVMLFRGAIYSVVIANNGLNSANVKVTLSE